MCDVVVLKGSEQKSYLQLFKFCTFVTPTPSVLSHITTSCAGECGLSVLAALNTMFPARALKGSGWVAAIFSTHIASLPCSDLNDSSVWEWKKGFVSPLDELPITTGPTAVVTHYVSMCQGVCFMCTHSYEATSGTSQDCSEWSWEDCQYCAVFNKLPISLWCAVIILTMSRQVAPSSKHILTQNETI